MDNPSIGASSSQPVLQEEEEEEEKEEKEEEGNPEEIVTLLESSNEFEVFNQSPSSEDLSADIDSQQQVDIIIPDEMGIQRKSQRSLMDLIESQLGRDVPGKSTQPNFLHLLPNLLFLLLSHLCHRSLILLIRKGRESRREKM